MSNVGVRLRPIRTEEGRHGVLIQETWEAYASVDGTTNGDYDLAGYVDPKTAIQTPGIPQYGANYGPPYPQALCVSVGVVEVKANWSVILLVTYRSYDLYRGGPRAIASAYNTRVLVMLPIWRLIGVDGIFHWVQITDQAEPRPVAIRTETRFVGGNQVTAVQQAIATNVGQLYTIDGVQYRLSEQSSAFYDGTAYTRANYKFWRDQQMPSIPAGGDFGNDVLIPALPPLYSWRTYPAPDLGAPPIIRAVPPVASNGGALPNFP